MPRRSRRLAFALPMALLALSMVSPAFGEPEVLAVPGLAESVEILRDKWGIAHIYARNEADLFFAQGFNVARDRLFQLEVWRRQATGTLAEVQGPRALLHDVGSRRLRYRGDMADELGRYHPRGRLIVESFVRGINAYVEATERDPKLLPVEFAALGIKPGRWTPEVVVSRHNGLFRNATQEVQAAQLVQILGEDRARELLHLHPGRPRLTLDPALDLGGIRDNILGAYKASRAAVRFKPEDVGPAYRGKPLAFETGADPTRIRGFEVASAETQGSNNWVVSGARTVSGKPIMANDPHRTIDNPSLRYWVHLIAPGWDVIGGGEPALPGISIGHNPAREPGDSRSSPSIKKTSMFMTPTRADPNRYRFQDGWESMRVERESIAVKGKAAVEATLRVHQAWPGDLRG